MPPTSETAQLRVDQSLLQPSVRVFILFNLDIDSSVFHLANYSNMRISACRPTAGFIRSQTRYLHLKSSNDALYTFGLAKIWWSFKNRRIFAQVSVKLNALIYFRWIHLTCCTHPKMTRYCSRRNQWAKDILTRCVIKSLMLSSMLILNKIPTQKWLARQSRKQVSRRYTFLSTIVPKAGFVILSDFYCLNLYCTTYMTRIWLIILYYRNDHGVRRNFI